MSGSGSWEVAELSSYPVYYTGGDSEFINFSNQSSLWAIGSPNYTFDYTSGILETAYFSSPTPLLNLSYEKNKKSLVMQKMFTNTIKWDFLDEAKSYNIYRNVDLSDRIYCGYSNHFSECFSENIERTYYVTWVDSDGLEQESQSITVPRM